MTGLIATRLVPKDIPTYLAFPIELLTVIQKFLEPPDIIALRKTCKRLASVTYDRGVWVDALTRVCIAHGIFLPSFPLKDMSRRALEYAALVPYRFNALLRGNHPVVDPRSVRLLRNARLGNEGERGDFDQVWLVPGGRFLVTTDDEDVIRLWDLGFSPFVAVNPIPLASFQVGDIDLDIKGLVPKSDGLGILMVTTSFLQNDTEAIQIYEMNPLSNSPEIKLFCEMESPVNDSDFSEVFDVTDRFAAFQCGEFIVVWDFVENLKGKWATQKSYSEILIMGEYLILCDDRRCFEICKIPLLHPNFNNSQDPSSMTILRSFFHPCSRNTACYVYHPCTWPQGLLRPAYFTFSGVPSAGDRLFGYFAMVPPEERLSSPTSMPVQTASINVDGLWPPACLPSRLCCGSLIQLRLTADKITAIVMDFPSTRLGSKPGISVELYDIDVTELDFCPFSGRLCIVDRGEIRIIDYVMPPYMSN